MTYTPWGYKNVVMNLTSRFALSLLLMILSVVALAHEGHNLEGAKDQKSKLAEVLMTEIYGEIDSSYSRSVRPIFQRSCFACHSASVSAPWYAEIPIAKQLITSDMTEAKEHLELSQGFPFGGHGSPAEDLEAIQKSVQDGTMPTKLYRLMHPSSKLSDEEKKQVIEWANDGLKRISSIPHEKSDEGSKHHK